MYREYVVDHVIPLVAKLYQEIYRSVYVWDGHLVRIRISRAKPPVSRNHETAKKNNRVRLAVLWRVDQVKGFPGQVRFET